ncbi:MAG: ATP-binding cassette domain-containing protein [Halobacteriaceae archaeon]
MVAISIDNLTKYYGNVEALNDLSLSIDDGEIFGFLGPNGAGKSTTIDIILDFVRPTSGNVSVLGFDTQSESTKIRSRAGVLPEQFSPYDRLSGRQHVEFVAESKGISIDADRYLSRVGLGEDGGRKAGGYSKGMKQRLGLAMSLVGEPEILILDEPSTGLDPNGAREMRNIIKEENQRGTTIFFSSHILGQVEAVCDRVGILRDGELVAEDSISGLRDAIGSDTQLSVTVDTVTDELTQTISNLSGVSSVSVEDDSLTIRTEPEAKTTVLNAIEEEGVSVLDFSTEEASLEELFAAYTEGEQ